MLPWHGALTVLLCVLGPLHAAADQAADQAVYRARFKTLMTRAGRLYAPMEAVAGMPAPVALPVARPSTIATDQLRAASDYARANRSTALLVWRNGKIEAADYFNGTTPATALVSKSLAKPLTAIAIGRAIAIGAIRSLDEPVCNFLPEWRVGPKSAILVRHLLDMRSGMLGQAISRDPANILNRAYLDPHHDDIIINAYPLLHAPGTRFDYANAVSDLVAIVIERATHERYARFISRQVLRPVGAAGGEVWLDRPGGVAHSGCCITLPAESWLRLAILLIQDGVWEGRRLLPAGYVEMMRQPTAQNRYFGLGIYVAAPFAPLRGFGNLDSPGPRVRQSEPYLARDLTLFDGNDDQVVYMVPSERLIVLRLGGVPPVVPGWDNAVLPNLILRGLPGGLPRIGAQPSTGTDSGQTPLSGR